MIFYIILVCLIILLCSFIFCLSTWSATRNCPTTNVPSDCSNDTCSVNFTKILKADEVFNERKKYPRDSYFPHGLDINTNISSKLPKLVTSEDCKDSRCTMELSKELTMEEQKYEYIKKFEAGTYFPNGMDYKFNISAKYPIKKDLDNILIINENNLNKLNNAILNNMFSATISIAEVCGGQNVIVSSDNKLIETLDATQPTVVITAGATAVATQPTLVDATQPTLLETTQLFNKQEIPSKTTVVGNLDFSCLLKDDVYLPMILDSANVIIHVMKEFSNPEIFNKLKSRIESKSKTDFQMFPFPSLNGASSDVKQKIQNNIKNQDSVKLHNVIYNSVYTCFYNSEIQKCITNSISQIDENITEIIIRFRIRNCYNLYAFNICTKVINDISKFSGMDLQIIFEGEGNFLKILNILR